MDTVAVPDLVDVAPARRVEAGRVVLGVAACLVVVQLVVRGWVAGSGFFYWDDLILVGRAGSYSLWSADLLLYNHDGHFMPLAFATAWVVTRVAPLTWAGPVVSLVVLQLVASVAVVRMLVVLAGVRWAILVPLGFYLFCPLTLPAYAWWAAALNALPLQFALAWVIGDAVRLLETGRRRYAVSAVVVLGVALLFFEKSVIVPFAAFAVVVLVRHVDGLGSALRVVARRGVALWAGSGVVIACWLAGYLTVVDVSAVQTSPAELRDLLPDATSLGIVPTLFGGPWSWERWLPSTPWADPPGWAVVSAWVALCALVLLSMRARLRVGPVWLTAAVYVLVAQLPVALARSGPNTAGELMQSLRYFADIAVISTAAGALILRAQPRDHAPDSLPGTHAAEMLPGLRDLARGQRPRDRDADSRRRAPVGQGRVRALFAGTRGHAAAALPDSQCDATTPKDHTPGRLADSRRQLPAIHGRARALFAVGGRMTRWIPGMGSRIPVFVPGPRVTAVLGAVFLVSSLWSTTAFVKSWRINPTKTYVTNVKAALAGADGVPLLEQEVPWDVLNPTAYPQNLVSRVLAPIAEPNTFADSTPRLRMITDSGEIVAAAVWWNRSALPGPEGGCGYRIRGPQPSDIPLDGPMLEHEWTVQLNYLANEDGRITVSFEHGEPVGVPVREGLNTVYVRVIGSGSMLRISPRTTGLDLCLGVGPVGVASYDN
ncbi:hypothetical protein ACIBG0_13870 [Nocardia sp. NPDC050630]|uniref:hypothetical protein n=1 Tax=Nocardia sp. NPDC050630 TaxID=3364321 RepID=UPI0037B0AEF8